MGHMTGSHFCRWYAGVRLQASHIPARTREGPTSSVRGHFLDAGPESEPPSKAQRESAAILTFKTEGWQNPFWSGSPVCLLSFRKCQSYRRIWSWKIGKTFLGKTGILMFACKPFPLLLEPSTSKESCELLGFFVFFFLSSFFFASLTLN